VRVDAGHGHGEDAHGKAGWCRGAVAVEIGHDKGLAWKRGGEVVAWRWGTVAAKEEDGVGVAWLRWRSMQR